MPDIIEYDLETRTDIGLAVATRLGAGAKLKFRDAADNVCAIFPLNNPYGTVANGVTTVSGLPKSVTAVADGVLDNAVFTDAADVIRISGFSIGQTGSDASFIVENVNVVTGQEVILNSPGTITHV